MKVLILGAQSQLGQSLKVILNRQNKKIFIDDNQGILSQKLKKSEGIEFVFLDRSQLDITHFHNVRIAVNNIKPNIIINCAAYTDVEQADLRAKHLSVNTINADSLNTLSEICKNNDILLIHISTDYVFDGKANTPYVAEAPCNPLNQYGISKRQGELNVIQSGCKYLIIRTSWLFSEFGNNFVKSMLKFAEFDKEQPSAKQLQIVADQRGNPTYAGHFAGALIQVVQQYAVKSFQSGIYHFSDTMLPPSFFSHQQPDSVTVQQVPHSAGCSQMDVSWYDFAKNIFKLAQIERASFIEPALVAVATRDYVIATGQQAERPKYSSLNCDSFYAEFGVKPTDWREGLKKVIKACKAEIS